MSTQKIALAIDNIREIRKIELLIEQTRPWVSIYKIGLEQFIRFGPDIISTVKNSGKEIFLDLKLHDIPNTVGQAVRSASDLKVDYLTIHIQGGIAMMKAAMDAKSTTGNTQSLKIIGVTLLTSIDGVTLKNELSVPLSTQNFVQHLTRTAIKANLDGIVCSATELKSVVPIIPHTFEVITPGIRPTGSNVNDQKRVATPSQAIQDGSTILVIGRAITSSADPAKTACHIFNEIHSAPNTI